jgi:hypothetical protein
MDVRTQMRSSAGYYAQREAIVAGCRRLTFAQADVLPAGSDVRFAG